jgi:hypothetical protein
MAATMAATSLGGCGPAIDSRTVDSAVDKGDLDATVDQGPESDQAAPDQSSDALQPSIDAKSK